MPILNRLREELVCGGKKTTEDLLFTLDTVHCLARAALPRYYDKRKRLSHNDADAAAKLISDLRENENENAGITPGTYRDIRKEYAKYSPRSSIRYWFAGTGCIASGSLKVYAEFKACLSRRVCPAWLN